MILKYTILFTAIFFLSMYSVSQQSSEMKEKLENHYEKAMLYNEVSLYGESIGELNEVISLARKYGFDKEFIRASIVKAELFRKTENFKRGIELLYQLQNTEKYPKLHVQKLGRLAALYAEDATFSKDLQRDSIKAFVEEGIELSMRFGLKEEEASLRNELGFSQNRNKEFDIALENLERASQLYHEIQDEENEMGVRINILDLYVSRSYYRKSDSLYPILTKEIYDKEWYAIKSKLYSIISIRYMSEGDTNNEVLWRDKANAATVAKALLMNTKQMASFKVIHDTNLFKEDALKKTMDLELQKSKTQRLLFFALVLVLIVILVVLIFVRERRLKSKLDVTVNELNAMNDKYEMLIIESNHRIKNNLQMIISMLEFTKKGVKDSEVEIIRSLSGKIQTISSLHKQLYVDLHNEHVDLNVYFKDILSHYKDIGLKYDVKESISHVKIRSERIVYFGLILNEMLSNTFKHGVSKDLNIVLKVEESGDFYSFQYSDGSPHLNNLEEGTGTKLIRQLIGRIEGSDYKKSSEIGEYRFEFKAGK